MSHASSRRGARNLAYISMGAALIALCAWIAVPAAIPFTLQTFAVCLVAALLGWRRGFAAVALYLLLGAVGLPVFSGFSGGFGVLLGVTGGYLVGFLLTALVVGLAAGRFGQKTGALTAAMALGILLCYAFGTGWFVLVYTKNSGPIGLGAALGLCVLPYLPADAAKILLAALVCRRLSPLMKKGGFSA
ncbi:MAG: biotin transporter BioY [Oscillospiraceae bacterium]|nr:biotin transporter BioY [Oscillospiraceae bacterium]